MSTALVVGSNRGIGLELCRIFSKRGDAVVAACRKSSPELAALKVEVVEGVDVTSADSVTNLGLRMARRPIDLLVVVAGILRSVSLDDMDFDVVREQFEVNAMGPLRVVSAMLDDLRRGSKIALLTSRMGSMDDNTSGGHYAYRMSKAALNMAGKTLSVDLAERGIAVTLLHPGFVKTAMTGGQGNITAAESAGLLVKRIDELTHDTTGLFRHANGESIPW